MITIGHREDVVVITVKDHQGEHLEFMSLDEAVEFAQQILNVAGYMYGD